MAIGAATVGRRRQAATHDLAERDEISGDAVASLRSRPPDTKPRHHLVENEERTVRFAPRAEAFEKACLRRDAAHVAGDRLDDDRRNLLGVRVEQRVHRSEVVEGGRQRVRGHPRWDAGAVRHAERCQTRSGPNEESVGVAVIAARELDDLVASSCGARDADG
jgi:hypothetical protein